MEHGREEGGKGKDVMVDSTEINIVQKAWLRDCYYNFVEVVFMKEKKEV